MKDRKQRKINQKKSKKIEQVVRAESQIKIPSVVKNDNLWWEQPSYKKNLTDSVDGPLRISREGYVLRNNGDFPTSSPNELGLVNPSHLFIKSNMPTCIPDNNSYVASTLSMQNSPWLGEMGLGILGNTITLGEKSIQDLEKEEQKRLIDKLSAQIKTQGETIKDLNCKVEENQATGETIKDLKRQVEENQATKQDLEALKKYVIGVMAKKTKNTKNSGVRSNRALMLLWDGDSVYDSENIECVMTCRKGFPKKILEKCFENFDSPKRNLSRHELDMSPQEIKKGLKNIVTNWSEKFLVSREVIEGIISFKKNEGLIVISDNINFKHSPGA